VSLPKRSFLRVLYDEIKINYMEAERMKNQKHKVVFESETNKINLTLSLGKIL